MGEIAYIIPRRGPAALWLEVLSSSPAHNNLNYGIETGAARGPFPPLEEGRRTSLHGRGRGWGGEGQR